MSAEARWRNAPDRAGPDAGRRRRLSGGAAPHPGRQILFLTAAAVALFVVVRRLPTGTNLSHMDFRVQGGNSIEFCDPLNPQFIPVVAVRSPVTMNLSPAEIPAAAAHQDFTFTLRTTSGRPIGPEDLLVVHTQRLHLLIVDPTLTDYQHVHPIPGRAPGEWRFGFVPRFSGSYRVFADFTPIATNRGLYAYADLLVRSGPAGPPDLAAERADEFSAVTKDDLRIALAPKEPVRTGRPAELRLTLRRAGGGPVAMEMVMGTYAHLVAFDRERSGFAHLHPAPLEVSAAPDPVQPAFSFKITIPRPGPYVIWAQCKVAGREIFAPFRFTVAP